MRVFYAPTGHNFCHSLLVVCQNLIKGMLLGVVGLGFLAAGFLIYQASPISWWKIVVAIPLAILGLSITLLAFYKILAAILDRRYSQTHCPICQRAVKVSLDGEF